MWSRRWAAYLGAGVLAVAVRLALPPLGAALAYDAVGVSAVLAVALAARRAPSLGRLPWLLLLGGQAALVAGDVAWDALTLGSERNPFPSVADALYLAAYPLLAGGLHVAVRRRTPWRDAGAVLDAAVVSIGVGVPVWALLVAPAVGADTGGLERVVSAAYPLGDLVLLGLVLRAAFTSEGSARIGAAAPRLLWACLATHLVTDLAYAASELLEVPVPGFAIDSGFLIGYLLLGAAALHPSATALVEPRPAPPTRPLTGRRLAFLAGAALIAPATLAVQASLDAPVDELVVASGSAALFLLVLARAWGLLQSLEASRAELARLSAIDPLTGAGNRRAWDDALEFALADRVLPVSIVLLDLDRFKGFNDTFGHAEGDELLREVAETWRRALLGGEVLVRWGGEEFAVLLVGCELSEVVARAERLRLLMPRAQTCSAGVAVWDGEEPALDLVRRADLALYTAKAEGRDRVVALDADTVDQLEPATLSTPSLG